MAGEQDIVSLGLDITSFDAKKLATLKQYITLFDTLAKYDGKIFNPVMGDGLQKFNTSIAETNRLVDELNGKLIKLNSTKITGKAFPKKEVDEFSKGLGAADRATQSFNVNAGGSVVTLEKIGTRLTSMLTTMRYLAFILPGIGIAGIFNLAFQAIGAAANGIVDFTDKTIELAESEKKLNDIFKDQKSTLDKLVDSYKSLNRVKDDLYTGNEVGGEKVIVNAQKELDLLTSRGYDKGILFDKEIKLLELKKQKAESDFTLIASNVDPEKFIEGRLKVLADYQERIVLINNALAKGSGVIDREFITSDKKLKKMLEATKSSFEKEANETNNFLKIYSTYFDAKKELEDKNAEYKKFKEDQARKLLVETSKDDIALDLANQKAILDNDKNFHDRRKRAILQEFEDDKRLANISLYNVTGNLSSTPAEINIATNKANDDILKAEIKRDAALESNRTQFYQRKLLALTEINKDETEMEAIKNLKIANNENHSLEERLDAYEKYIVAKHKIDDLEFAKDIQRSADSAGGLTSLTPEEQQRLDTHRTTQQFNTQADVEKKFYDIVKQSLDARIKLIIDENQKEQSVNKEAYAKELHDLNEKYKNRMGAYESFKKNKEFIDKKYGVLLSIDDEIKDDEQDVSRLKALYDELNKKKQQSDISLHGKKGVLDSDKSLGLNTLDSERYYNEELGRNTAFADEMEKIAKDLADAEDKLGDDKVRKEKKRYEELIQFNKEHAANIKAIEQQTWKFVELMINRNVENELNAIEQMSKARNEQFGLQEKAVEESSLNAKDKAALEIQLTEQQLEANKAAELEERRIKHDAAVRSRDLSAAQVLFNTIVSVTEALKLPFPEGEILAAERGVLGTIELASLYAVKIPEYKHGIIDKPFGSLSRYGEGGNPELVKIPGQEPFVALKDTVSYLPKGTDVIPLTRDSPIFNEFIKDESWEQTKFLAKWIKKSNKEVINVFKPTIVIDMGFENRKRQVLGN